MRCRNNENTFKYRERKREAREDEETKETRLNHARRIVNSYQPASGYEEFVDSGFADLIYTDKASQKDAAMELGVTQAAVSKWQQFFEASKLIEAEMGEAWSEWKPPEPYSDDPVEDFAQFRYENFQTETGEPYTTPPHQRRWIAAVLDTWERGGKLVILSPPRHGKTDLLIHFCIWVIVRNPNIRILYIGGSHEIAEYSVGSVKDHLEANENLEKWKPPYKDFRPKARSGRSWTVQRFTVATRTIIGMKGPTMKSVGRGGRILSLDTDLIIVDDPEDHDSTLNPGTRADTRGWWGKSVMSRKMEKTAVCVIGSRVHPDDLVGHLAASDEYEAIVEQVHDEALCTGDKDDTSAEAHWDCMLWPEVRSYKWALDKKLDPIEGETFEMVYQNRALDAETATFKPEDIDACFDTTRGLGHIPKRTRLIGGLDPSVSGYQAAFLWAVDIKTGRRYMVDIDNHLGGGVEPALEIMKRWFEAYRLSHWVIEENLYHGAIRTDETITKWARRNYITLEGHETWGTNKWDRHMGVTSMARYFRDETEDGKRLVSLPAADFDARAKSSEYRKQLLNFNRDVQALASNSRRSRKAKSDIVMAAWFPEAIIRRWQHESSTTVNYTYDKTSYPFQRMSLGRMELNRREDIPLELTRGR